ncbi:MAG: HAD-IIB family hydrolase [bacterium]
MAKRKGLYILLISVHGLIRGDRLELGRDPDTGGQTLYVVDLLNHLADNPLVDRVDLLTRQVYDPAVDVSYTKSIEKLSEKAHIIRVPCGPKRYLRKESLWPHLESFTDQTLKHIRKAGRSPDIIHAHYADAGYVGSHLANLIGVPLVFTGHSLGRVKRRRLINKSLNHDRIEKQYHLAQRIEAEEVTLDNAELVVASTLQEVIEQYGLYDNFHKDHMVVIPPGVNLKKFFPQDINLKKSPFFNDLKRFLKDPTKPVILAMSRPDTRKNIMALIHAYANDKALKEKANLVLVLGARDNIRKMPAESRSILTELLLLIDKYDLYGHIAYPKGHESNVANVYRVSSKLKGVFVNPALIEPFGLTLIEAAACGIPIVATEHGGPQDIIKACQNGLLINPYDTKDIADAIKKVLSHESKWDTWSQNGIKGAKKHFSWNTHTETYLKHCQKVIKRTSQLGPDILLKNRLPVAKRAIITDIDNTLIGDKASVQKLLSIIKRHRHELGFGIATGRTIDATVKILIEWGIPIPDVMITGVGCEIYYGSQLIPDKAWSKHINYRWNPNEVKRLMKKVKGLITQKASEQREFKLSYDVAKNNTHLISAKMIKAYLRRNNIHVNVIFSHGKHIDILPLRTSKGAALRYFALKWDLPFENLLVAGDSGNDVEMLIGDVKGVVVGNYSPEMEKLKEEGNIYFAKGHYAAGIVEAINHFDFFS